MFIYKISNDINDKVYIGQTVRPIEARFRRHINDAMNNVLDTHFARAIRMYGPEHFSIELIDQAQSQEELTLKEQQWIKYYDSVNVGYNETDACSKCGGNTYKSKTEEEMEDIKEKIRQSKLGGKNPQSTKIKCKNIETEQELFFDSMAEGRDYFKQTNHQFISRRCRGTIKNLFQGKWMFAYQDQDYLPFSSIPNASRAKRILVENKDTQEKKEFSASTEASLYCGLHKDYISKKFVAIKPQKQFEIKNFVITLLN